MNAPASSSGNPLASPGDVLLGKYRVERHLGMGSMGVVVAAMHLELEQRVAIKFMLPGKAPQSDQYTRFLREAQAAGRLKSQHVAKVLDVGKMESGAPYMVMEYLEGRDLAAELGERGPLPIEEAVGYVLQACEAVAEAHVAGIVHRDLKPANLFLTRSADGSACVKVLDFGVSKMAGAKLGVTREGQALGSPLYMSPEQMGSSRDVDARTDLWALGVILYELTAGQTPFNAGELPELVIRVLQGDPTPLRALRPDVPAGLEAVVMQCLEKDRERRWSSATELAAALAPFATASAGAYVARVAGVQGATTKASKRTERLEIRQAAAEWTANEPTGGAPYREAQTAERMGTTTGATAEELGLTPGRRRAPSRPWCSSGRWREARSRSRCGGECRRQLLPRRRARRPPRALRPPSRS
jgi:eukaryotic-like serine/threonine-protein kinase